MRTTPGLARLLKRLRCKCARLASLWVGLLAALLTPLIGVAATGQAAPASQAGGKAENAYSFSFTSLSSPTPLALAQFKGKVLLVVNTASQCGFTSQYEGLEALYKTYQAQGLVVVGVPSNNFGSQEPGSNQDIAQFCQANYGVSFPMAGKTVVSGPQAHPFYQWARQQLGAVGAPQWNFHKYLVGRDGKLIDFYLSTTAPNSEKLRKAIEAALK